MNQFQIINRHETWRDEKKDENKQDPADREREEKNKTKKLSTSRIKLLYLALPPSSHAYITRRLGVNFASYLFCCQNVRWIASESICRGIERNVPCFFAWVHLRDWTSSRVIRLSEVRSLILSGIFIWRRAQAVAQHFDVQPSSLAICTIYKIWICIVRGPALPCQRVGALVFSFFLLPFLFIPRRYIWTNM